MGITIVQKSDLAVPAEKARTALVLAGGAISGGAFKLGGLVALNRYFRNWSVNDFDIFMGISAGAFLAAPLSAGVTPRDMFGALDGTSEALTKFSALDFYKPNWRGFLRMPMRVAQDMVSYGPRMTARVLRTMGARHRDLTRASRRFLRDPTLVTAEDLVSIFAQELQDKQWGERGGYLPAGLFDNSRLERYTRTNLERNGLPNNFRQLKLETGKSLYIGATNLNTGQGVVFGHDEDNTVTVSEAVMASSAIPGFFVPARCGPPGREQEYVDAAVRKTANISTAVRHGAQLVICYNPFRPFLNYRHRALSAQRQSIGDLGLTAVLNQAFRTMLYSRLRLGIEKLRLDESFKGDVILIEPQETDARFFAMNPIAFWQRGEAGVHGFQSTKESLSQHHDRVKQILAKYGIEVSLSGIDVALEEIRSSPKDPTPRPGRGKPKNERRLRKRKRPDLKLVVGGS